MKLAISGAAILFALAAGTDAVAASRGCSVTHHQCYPACVRMTPDGSDCAQTKDVCRDICGARPSYPSVSNTEQIDVMRFETMKPMPDPDTQDRIYYDTTSPR